MRKKFRDADAVIDLVGGETQVRSFPGPSSRRQADFGSVPPGSRSCTTHGVEAAFFLVNVTRQCLTEIARLVDGGKLRTHVGAVLPLADAREAHFMLERVRPQPKGKIVLTVGAELAIIE